MKPTKIAAEKIQAYAATEYHLIQPTDSIILHVDRPCKKLSSLFTTRSVQSAALITAYNPLGTQQSPPLNTLAQQTLITQINTLGYEYIEAVNISPQGNWPPEPSLFIFGIPIDAAFSLGQRFNQDALIWVAENYIPKLLLLR